MTVDRIEQKVLKQIKDGRVEMRTHRSIVVGRVVFIFSLAASSVLMFIFVSFILHALQRSGVLYLPTFGIKALGYLLHPFSAFIIVLIVITNLIAVAMAIVIGRATAAYRAPLLYVWAGVFLSITLGAIAVYVTPFHDVMHAISSDRHIPVIESLYRSASEDTDANTATGLIRNVRSGGFELVGLSRRIITVETDGHTAFTGDVTLKEGEVVIVVGDWNGEVMKAEFVRKYPGTLTGEELQELKKINTSVN